MKILFLSTENPYPPDHGHHIRTLHILKGLAKQNEIFFLGFAQDKNELQYIDYLEKRCKLVFIDVIEQGIFKWRYYLKLILNLFSPYPYTVQRYQTREAKSRIAQILKEHKIDLVHVDMLHLAAYHEELDGVPKILVNHNVESLRMLRWLKVEKNILMKTYLFLQYLKLKKFEQRMCPIFDCCVVVSDADREILYDMTRHDNFFVIPNGVDTEYFKPGELEYEPHSLVWVGGMEGPYNRDAVIFFIEKIFPLIESNFPAATVTFVGASPPPKLMKKANENPKIKVIGYVDDVRPYVDKAAIFVAPIRSGSGTKIKILNALSQAKAVVTTAIGAEGIEVNSNQDIIIANSPQDFADAITYLFRNQPKIRELGKNARKIIEEKYSWETINKKVDQLYEELVIRQRS